MCIMFGVWIRIIWRTYLKRFGTIGQKIQHCDLLHCFMFHDKKSCGKTMFLSFIVGGVSFECITFGSWIQCMQGTSWRGFRTIRQNMTLISWSLTGSLRYEPLNTPLCSLNVPVETMLAMAVSLWRLQWHYGWMCCMPATVASSVPANAASSVPVTQPRLGG